MVPGPQRGGGELVSEGAGVATIAKMLATCEVPSLLSDLTARAIDRHHCKTLSDGCGRAVVFKYSRQKYEPVGMQMVDFSRTRGVAECISSRHLK